MIPSAFVFLDALPLSPVGKVDRAALPEPGRSRPPLDVAYVAPRTRLETPRGRRLGRGARAGASRADADFLELGGHSLAATRLLFRLNQRLGLDLPFPNLFEAPTVAAQARAILEVLAAKLPEAELPRLLDQIEPR